MHLILDRYEVLKTLGRGGMADILQVKDHALSNQSVALKRCHNASLNPQLVREFFTLRSVQHPSLPTVFDFHSDLGDGRAGYTLEVVNGDTIDHWSRSASPEDLHRVFVDVLRALAHIHGQGLVHGDLHPQNILVCQKEDGRVDVKVLDLSPTDDERLEHAAMPFLAPERLAGEPASAASDLFSFGVCMYQLITGMLPYPDYPHIDISSFPKASEKLGRLHDLVTALLSPQARQRPASASETLNLLAAQLDQEIEPFTAMAVDATLQAGPTIPIGDWPTSVIASVTSKLQGSGGLLAVCGGLGTGKTRVLDEIRWHLQGYTNAQVLDVQTSRVVTDGAIIRELIPQVPQSILNKLPEAMAELAETFVTGDAITDGEGLDQNHSRRRLSDQLAQLFLAVSAQQPLAIIVDDYVSQDSLTTDVFCALLRALVHTEFQSHGVCLVVSGEDREDMARLVEPAVKVATIVTPPTFGYDATCRLISSTFAGLAASHELATELHSGTAGNPRYTVETLSNAFRKGWLQNLSATLSLTPAAPRPLPIPTSIIDALESRLRSLPKEQLEILSFLHF